MQRPGEFPPIYFVPGDTVQFTMNFVESDGDPHDLTGATCEAQVRSVSGSDDDPLLADFTLIGTPGSSGAVTLRLTPATSLGLKGKKNLVWDMQVTYASGIVRTLVAGILSPLKDVTQ